MILVEEGQFIDMMVVNNEALDKKYNLIILDYYDHDIVNNVFLQYGSSIDSVSFYKNGVTIPMNNKYVDYKNATIYINVNSITMYDFVLRDEDIIFDTN